MKNNNANITIVGSGYVGMSLSVLLAQHNKVTVLDISKEKIDKINKKKSTISDSEIDSFLSKKKLNLSATLDKEEAYKNADYIVLAVPTNFDIKTKYFDTSSLDSVIDDAMKYNSKALIVIKSTVPFGYTKQVQKKYSSDSVIFSPEFLREGSALQDNLYPSRIVIGSKCNKGKVFASLLTEAAIKNDIPILYMESSEAEAVKLFANTYLAMRVAFFNELDSFTMIKNLDTKSIINGISYDERIGNAYNNPSFGYGGYCLPKDTKQLLSNFKDVPQSLIEAIVLSNEIRFQFIADEIIKINPSVVGIYRLAMKEGSDNFRSSAIQSVIKILRNKEFELIIYEPDLSKESFEDIKVISSLEKFKKNSTIILANRNDNLLMDVKDKIFTRDIYGNN